ncbi:hypothetical protein ACW9YV_08965 [Paraburkholderia strydomiana]
MQANRIVTTPPVPQTLDISHLQHLASAMRLNGQPVALFRAVHEVAASVIGFRLLTIMSYDAGREEVERAYTNMPDVYPVGGRKKNAAPRGPDRFCTTLSHFAQKRRKAFSKRSTITR